MVTSGTVPLVLLGRVRETFRWGSTCVNFINLDVDG